MAKNITRTITIYKITYLALDASEALVTLDLTDSEANPNLPKHPEKVAATTAKAMGMTFIKVKSVETYTQLYSMPIDDFLNYATPQDAS